jgi:hypothetical protein
MKKIVFAVMCLLLSFGIQANPSPVMTDGAEIFQFLNPLSDQEFPGFDLFIQPIDPENPSGQLDCTLTITLTLNFAISSITVSGTISGPCDEIKQMGNALLLDLLRDAKAKAKELGLI